MVSYLVGLWMAAAVGQAPAEASWLESVPADIPVVARVRALEDVGGDLKAMIKAMSPTLADAAAGTIDPMIQAFEGMYGEGAGKHPFFVMFRLPDPAQPNLSAWGVMVRTSDPAAVIKGLKDGDAQPKALEGYESFAGKDGQTWYAARGKGWLAFGPDEALIKAVHKPAASLASSLSPAVKARFLEGDFGLYLNVAQVHKQYGDLIDQAGPGLLAQLEQAPNMGGDNAKNLKMMYDALLGALKAGDHLALSLDFDTKGLTVSAMATVKADSAAAKGLAASRTGTARLMERLPADKMMYFYLANAASNPTPAASPELQKAVADRMKALEGRLVMGMSLTPMQFIALSDPSDPQAAVKATLDAAQGRHAAGQEKSKIEPDALTLDGFKFARTKVEVDTKQISKDVQAKVPNGGAIIQMMLTGKDLTTYTGTDGKLFLEVTGSSEDQIKSQVEAVKDAGRGLGASPSWKALRARFPDEVSVLVLLNAQETIKLMVTGIGATMNRPDLKAPADLPRAPALMGFALISSPKGYDLRIIIPSDVGPVFEKGLAPLGGLQ
jgi:hypothetical protein